MELLIASQNRGKVAEIRHALRSLPIKLVSLNQFPHSAEVDEVGQTYEENAIIKAIDYSKQTNLWALADDSGLEVDALGGAPGVFTARYAGVNTSYTEKMQSLLTALSAQSGNARKAKFVCVMALVGSKRGIGTEGLGGPKVLKVTEGICEGTIADEARGTNGFGFDPVFVPRGYDLSFAQLGDDVKATISHRGRALIKMREFLSAATIID